MDKLRSRRGVALLSAFIVMVTMSTIALAFLNMVNDDIKRIGAEQGDLQACYIAKAGMAKARWALTTNGQVVGWGETDTAFGTGTYTVTTTNNGDNTYTIISAGYVPNATNPIAKRRVEERSMSVSTASLTNLSLGATASASSYKGSHTPDKANDGSTNTQWRVDGTPSVGNPQWLAINLGSSQTFNRVVFDEKDVGQITAYQIQYSANGSSWSAVSSAVASRVGTVTTVDFAAVTVQYHRIYITASTDPDPKIREFQSYNTNQAVSVTLGQGKYVTTW